MLWTLLEFLTPSGWEDSLYFRDALVINMPRESSPAFLWVKLWKLVIWYLNSVVLTVQNLWFSQHFGWYDEHLSTIYYKNFFAIFAPLCHLTSELFQLAAYSSQGKEKKAVTLIRDIAWYLYWAENTKLDHWLYNRDDVDLGAGQTKIWRMKLLPYQPPQATEEEHFTMREFLLCIQTDCHTLFS